MLYLTNPLVAEWEQIPGARSEIWLKASKHNSGGCCKKCKLIWGSDGSLFIYVTPSPKLSTQDTAKTELHSVIHFEVAHRSGAQK